MWSVEVSGHIVRCDDGVRLRTALLRAGVSPHNGGSRALNCRGFGTCGTCAVRIEMLSGPPLEAPRGREKWRLSFPPHRDDSGLRLACQVRVKGDMRVSKFEGFWGQHVERRLNAGPDTSGVQGEDGGAAPSK